VKCSKVEKENVLIFPIQVGCIWIIYNQNYNLERRSKAVIVTPLNISSSSENNPYVGKNFISLQPSYRVSGNEEVRSLLASFLFFLHIASMPVIRR